jgi:23S rRNA pseudouridine1911/1915/1917 synthase
VSPRAVRLRVEAGGGRLDLTLARSIADLSRSRWQQLIRAGAVAVGGEVVTKPGFRLEGGEAVEALIPDPASAHLTPEVIPLDVVFENEHVLAVNKPAGMVVHPSVGHATGTLVHAALAYAPRMAGVGGEQRPGVVHRLDRDTSGLILLAMDDAAQAALQRQFKDRGVEKVYLALVDGRPPTPAGRIEAPVGRDPRRREMMGVVPASRGREAQTEYRTLERFPAHTLLEVHPQTGRTHQIRVHLAFLGCPVVGDRVYGLRRPSLPVSRQMLHAWRLRVTLPGEAQPRLLEAKLPEDFDGALEMLRRSQRSGHGHR